MREAADFHHSQNGKGLQLRFKPNYLGVPAWFPARSQHPRPVLSFLSSHLHHHDPILAVDVINSGLEILTPFRISVQAIISLAAPGSAHTPLPATMASLDLKQRRRKDYGYILEYRTRWSDNDMYDHMNNSIYSFL